MGALFGKSKSKQISHKISEHDKAVLQLKQQRDKLKQYKKRITNQLDRERNLARELLKNGKKDKALLLLKKKKYMENLLDKTDGQLENLEKLVMDIEFAQIEVQVIDGLKSGNEALKQLNSITSIEQIEDLLDETRESVSKQNEISELLSGAFTDEEESDLLAELATLTGEEEKPEQRLPDVPRHEPGEGEEKVKQVKIKAKKQLIEAD